MDLFGPQGVYLWIPVVGLGLTTLIKAGIHSLSTQHAVNLDSLDVGVPAAVLGVLGTFGVLVEGINKAACVQSSCPLGFSDAMWLLGFFLFTEATLIVLAFYEAKVGQDVRNANKKLKDATGSTWIKGFGIPFLLGAATLFAVSIGVNDLLTHGGINILIPKT